MKADEVVPSISGAHMRGPSDQELATHEPKMKHGKISVGGQTHAFVDLLEADTGVLRDCLPTAMDDRVDWRKKAMEVRQRSA